MRSLPDPGFAGDDGGVAPEVSEALATYAGDPDVLHLETLAVLQHARVLVPVVATLGEVATRGEVETDAAGLDHDKSSDMATVLMRGRDGRTALLAFTGSSSLGSWNPEARPVPVTVRAAAQAARQDGAEALVVDVAGPVLFVVEGEDLVALAEGWTLAEVSGPRSTWAWVRPDR